ncbi:hypothetical protein [Balneatrix alpica]|uniref:Uncharacterized protein n=1 Tax=Balneatrix alpica TaxID=75684 RepID=A0ABV5ZA02_9GAMM|nr:hypothetical protein [Balneatrix alpica]
MQRRYALFLTLSVLVISLGVISSECLQGQLPSYPAAMLSAWLMVGNWQGYHRLRRQPPSSKRCWLGWLSTVGRGPFNARQTFKPKR